MSNLVAAPGQSPDFDPRNIQTVRDSGIGAAQGQEQTTKSTCKSSGEHSAPQKARCCDCRQHLFVGNIYHYLPTHLLPCIPRGIHPPDYRSDRQRGNRSGAAGATFEQLARNTTKNDIPTLIEVLRSPVLLNRLPINLTSAQVA